MGLYVETQSRPSSPNPRPKLATHVRARHHCMRSTLHCMHACPLHGAITRTAPSAACCKPPELGRSTVPAQGRLHSVARLRASASACTSDLRAATASEGRGLEVAAS